MQGVGFRYTTCQIARQFQVSGYVQNLPDGRVHLVAEGEATELDRFLGAVQQQLEAYIRAKKSDCLAASGEFAAFGIR